MEPLVRRHERSGVTAAHVDAYRSAQLVRGWERGLLRFLMARVSGAPPLARMVSAPGAGVQGLGRVSAGTQQGHSRPCATAAHAWSWLAHPVTNMQQQARLYVPLTACLGGMQAATG